MRVTGSQVVWYGPPQTPGMMFRNIVEGDIVASMTTCMHCEHAFEPDEVIAENRSQTMAIHAKCILELAAMVPRSQPSAADVRAEYERRRAELASEQ